MSAHSIHPGEAFGDHPDRRSSPRQGPGYFLTCLLAWPPDGRTGGRILNLSRAGALLVCPRPFPPEVRLDLTLHHRVSGVSRQTSLCVVRCAPAYDFYLLAGHFPAPLPPADLFALLL